MGEDAIWQSTVKLNHGGSLPEIALTEEGHAGGRVHTQNPTHFTDRSRLNARFGVPLACESPRGRAGFPPHPPGTPAPSPAPPGARLP